MLSRSSPTVDTPLASEERTPPPSNLDAVQPAWAIGFWALDLRRLGATRGAILFLCALAAGTVLRGDDRLPASPPPAEPEQAVPTPWEKSDPMGDCKILWENGGPTFAVPGKGRHDFEALWPLVNQNAPCALRETADDFTLDVTVPPHSEGAEPFAKAGELRAAGLVVCSDEDRVVRLLRTGPKSVGVEWYYAGTLQGQKSAEVAEGPIHLRLEKREGAFYFSTSTDKSVWKRFWWAYDFTFGAQVKVGAVAINTSKQEFRARLPGLVFTSFGSPLDRELAPTWTPLFNGSDLTGWKFYPEDERKNKKLKKAENKTEGNEDLVEKPLDDWRVEDEVLVGKGKRRALYTETKLVLPGFLWV